MLRNQEDAEDAVQEAAVKAWRALTQLRDANDGKAWFLRIVANQCRTTMRGRWWRTLRFAELPGRAEGDPAESVISGVDLERALRRLSAQDRLVLHLHYGLDLQVEEVARVLGVGLGAAKSRLHRAARRLQPSLASEELP
jgi:RNA polymerase sigma-70 factor (ECF subfamily)